LTFLGQRMEEQLSAPYMDLDTLGNFIDNHDAQRVAKVCGGDQARVANSLAWTMLTKGVPIIYYGTEEMVEDIRDSFWQYGYNSGTTGFKLIRLLNMVRKTQDIGTASLEVMHSTPNHLVFTRGGADKVWVFMNNKGEDATDVNYCGGVVPPAPALGNWWVDGLSGKPLVIDHAKGCVIGADAFPMVAVQRKMSSQPDSTTPDVVSEPPSTTPAAVIVPASTTPAAVIVPASTTTDAVIVPASTTTDAVIVPATTTPELVVNVDPMTTAPPPVATTELDSTFSSALG